MIIIFQFWRRWCRSRQWWRSRRWRLFVLKHAKLILRKRWVGKQSLCFKKGVGGGGGPGHGSGGNREWNIEKKQYLKMLFLNFFLAAKIGGWGGGGNPKPHPSDGETRYPGIRQYDNGGGRNGMSLPIDYFLILLCFFVFKHYFWLARIFLFNAFFCKKVGAFCTFFASFLSSKSCPNMYHTLLQRGDLFLELKKPFFDMEASSNIFFSPPPPISLMSPPVW